MDINETHTDPVFGVGRVSVHPKYGRFVHFDSHPATDDDAMTSVRAWALRLNDHRSCELVDVRKCGADWHVMLCIREDELKGFTS